MKKIESPTGGPKDDQASKILKANPEIGETNFLGTELKIVFDEYVSSWKYGSRSNCLASRC